MGMKCPRLSERFDVKDIQKIREYNSLRHSFMTHEEMRADINKGANRVLACIEYLHDMRKIFDDDDEEKDPDFPVLSDRFDVDDIRKLRDYNSWRYMHMTPEEVSADIKKGAQKVLDAMEYLRGMDKIFFAEDDDDGGVDTSESTAHAEAAPASSSERAPEEAEHDAVA